MVFNMAKQNFYAVKIGKNPGIYQTWEQAQEQTMGFSHAVYKKFNTEAEAMALHGAELYIQLSRCY